MEKQSTSSEYEEFLTDLPEKECRWAVYDFEFLNDEGGLRKKIIFFHWYVGSSTKEKKMRENALFAQKISFPMAHIKCTNFCSCLFFFHSLSILVPFVLLRSLFKVVIMTRHGQDTR